MPSIRPCLWFDSSAEEAAQFYVSVFDNSRILDISRYGEGAPMPAGTVLTVDCEIGGQRILALNGGPAFSFNESMSLVVDAPTQAEIDRLWNALIADGGEPSQCGWLKDKYGLSWQIVPPRLSELLNGPDRAGANRAMQKMLTMSKLDIAALELAYEQP